MSWGDMWERLEERTCPHGVSLHEDCCGCDQDADAQAEEAAEPSEDEALEAWAEQEAEAIAEPRDWR